MKMKYVFYGLLQRNCFLQYPSASLYLPTLFPTVLDNKTAERCWKIILMQRSDGTKCLKHHFLQLPLSLTLAIKNALSALFVNEAAVSEDVFGNLIEQCKCICR